MDYRASAPQFTGVVRRSGLTLARRGSSGGCCSGTRSTNGAVGTGRAAPAQAGTATVTTVTTVATTRVKATIRVAPEEAAGVLARATALAGEASAARLVAATEALGDVTTELISHVRRASAVAPPGLPLRAVAPQGLPRSLQRQIMEAAPPRNVSRTYRIIGQMRRPKRLARAESAPPRAGFVSW